VALAAFCGGIIAAAALLIPLTLYMGWANVLRDINFTINARNSAESQALTADAAAFYDRMRVLFWPNYKDAAPLRTGQRLLEAVFYDHFRYYGPVLTAFIGFVLGGWMMSLRPGLSRQLSKPAAEIGILALTFVLFIVTPLNEYVPGGSHWVAALIGVAALKWRAGPASRASGPAFGWPEAQPARGALALILFGLIAWILRNIPSETHPRMLSIGAEAWLTHGSSSDGVMAVFVALGLALATFGFSPTAKRPSGKRSGGVASTLVIAGATLLAFIPVYWLFTGYVFSGYLFRQAPFLVFTTDLALAAALYLVMRAGWSCWQDSAPAGPGNTTQVRSLARRGLAGGLILIGIGVFGAWLARQLDFARIAPLDLQTVYRVLGEDEFRGQFFAVTTYASPVSAQTHAWSMMEPGLFTAGVRLTPRGYEMQREQTYRWFADRDTNPAYDEPAFALAQKATGWFSVLEEPRQFEGSIPPPPLDSVNLVRRARQSFTSFLHPQIAAEDDDPRGRFAIVKMDWRYPPYLAPLPVPPAAAAPAAPSDGESETWLLRLEVPSNNGGRVALRAVTIAGEPVDLADHALVAGSWSADPLTGALSVAEGPAWLTMSLIGHDLSLELERGPQAGSTAVWLNESRAALDLRSTDSGVETVAFAHPSAVDPFVVVPRFGSGQLDLTKFAGGVLAVNYHYRHQAGAPESDTLLLVQGQDSRGRWQPAQELQLLGDSAILFDRAQFLAANPETLTEYLNVVRSGDTRSFTQWLLDHLALNPSEIARTGLHPARESLDAVEGLRSLRWSLPADIEGVHRVGIAPGAAGKLGPTYWSENFSPPVALDRTGILRLSLTLPENYQGPPQPLVSVGVPPTGSAVFWEPVGPNSIRLGLDAAQRGKTGGEGKNRRVKPFGANAQGFGHGRIIDGGPQPDAKIGPLQQQPKS
jgi:hypothetical protein